MPLSRTLVLVGILFCLVLTGAFGIRCLEPQNLEEAAEPGAMESAQKPDEPTAIEKMNCLEIKVMFGDEEQEVEASYLVTWAYGFRTGATGMDFEKHPLTEEGFAAFVAHLMEVCSSDSEKLFVEAILE